MIDLAASILSANFACLGAEVQAAVEGGATVLHLDIMDGHFVPNLTIGPPVVAALRKVSPVSLDCHLMIEHPDEFIPVLAEAGVDWISVHHRNPDSRSSQERGEPMEELRRGHGWAYQGLSLRRA
jgi:ribulose-phosphate 3-epimerase